MNALPIFANAGTGFLVFFTFLFVVETVAMAIAIPVYISTKRKLSDKVVIPLPTHCRVLIDRPGSAQAPDWETAIDCLARAAEFYREQLRKSQMQARANGDEDLAARLTEQRSRLFESFGHTEQRDEERVIRLPDRGEVIVRMPDGIQPSMEECIVSIQYADNLLKMFGTVAKPTVAGKDKSAALLAFESSQSENEDQNSPQAATAIQI